jgi:hypothetical protein
MASSVHLRPLSLFEGIVCVVQACAQRRDQILLKLVGPRLGLGLWIMTQRHGVPESVPAPLELDQGAGGA